MGTIQDLKKISSKRLTHKLVSWIQRQEFKLHKPDVPRDITANPLYQILRAYRASEVQHIGQMDINLTGNSRIHGGEPIFEKLIPRSVVTAISGDTAEGVYKRLQDTVLAYRPLIVYDDSAGNNLLQGASWKAIIPIKRAQARVLRDGGARVKFLDVCPVGKALNDQSGVNAHIRDYNFALEQEFGPSNEFLSVAKNMTDAEGNMKPAYNSGDNVHHTIAAYLEIYVPTIQESLLQSGFTFS